RMGMGRSGEPARRLARQQDRRYLQALERGSLPAALDGTATGRLPLRPAVAERSEQAHETYGEHYGGWKRVLKAAGVPPVGTHGIRHGSATDIAHSGIPVKVGMALTAHKTVAMFIRYVHTEDDPVRKAAELV